MIILRFSLLAAVSASFFVSQVSKASAAKTPARLAPEIELSVRDVCYAYVDPSSKNRCEAIKTCIPRGEKILKGEIEKAKNDDKTLSRLHERLAELYAFEEGRLHLAIQTMNKAHDYAKKSERLCL